MIYTSYYARLRSIPSSVVPIAISRGIPTWYGGESYNGLAPRWDTVMNYKNGGSWAEYVDDYKETVLSKLDPSDVVNELMEISGGKSVALLCYETADKNCHRHLVAEWLNANGIDCAEF